MPDYSGTLQSFTITRTLAIVPALPLLAAVLCTVVSIAGPRAAVLRGARLAALCALSAVLSLAITIFDAVEGDALSGAHRYSFCHVATAVRIGSFDASLALVLDRLVLPLLIAVSVSGAAVLLSVAISARRAPPEPRILAAVTLLLAAVQTMLLADGFFLLLPSWAAIGMAGLVLRGWSAASAAARIAEVLLLLGVALVFWSYGGSWDHGEYVPALRPRLVAVGEASSNGASATSPTARPGLLSLHALPGSRIGLSGGAELCAFDAEGRPGGIGLKARPCREPARSPFARLPVPAAIHDFHVFGGPGTDELAVEKVRIQADKETLFMLLGPTLAFRELAEQLAVSDSSGERSVRRSVPRSELWDLPALALAMLLFVLAALVKTDLSPSTGSKAALQAPANVVVSILMLAPCAGVYLLARLGFLLALTPGVAALGALLGCAAVFRAAARALGEHDLRRVILLVAVAHASLAFVGVCGGAAEASLVYLAIALLAGVGSGLALGDGGHDLRKPIKLAGSRARWLGAFALSVAPLPVLGMVMYRVFAADATSFLPGTLLCALLAAGSGSIAFAVWSGYRRASGKAPPRAARRNADEVARTPPLQWLAGASPGQALGAAAVRAIDTVGGWLLRLEQKSYR